MADGFITLPPDSTGKKVDTEALTVSAQSVHRERVQIAGAADVAIAPVDATAGLKVDLGADNDVVVSGTVTVQDGAGSITVDDGGLTLTVDGTVTAELSAVDNAVLDAIAASNDAIKTAVELLDNIVAGTEAQVDVVAALPAGANKLGYVGDSVRNVWDDTDSVASAVKFAAVSAASAGNNTIVAAVATKKIRVLSYVLVAAGDVTVLWEDGTANLSGIMSLVANGGISATCEKGLFETAAENRALVLDLGGAIQVSGHITYVEVGG